MGKVLLVTGGARSGKSSFALEKATVYDPTRIFLATSVPFDHEMRKRVQNHRLERGELFTTVEQSYSVLDSLQKLPLTSSVVLLDCITVWMGNLFYKYNNDPDPVRNDIDRFVSNLGTFPFDLIMVTNEVGWGIVPENALAREFRDLAGYANRCIAAQSDEVYLCACGIPLRLK